MMKATPAVRKLELMLSHRPRYRVSQQSCFALMIVLNVLPGALIYRCRVLRGYEARVGHPRERVYSCALSALSREWTNMSQLVLATSSPPSLATATSASTAASTAASGTASDFVASSSVGLSTGSGAGGASVVVAA